MTDEIQKRIFAIRQPMPALLKYYVLSSFLLGPFFFIALIPLYFRYHTMQYAFDEEGISMKWGILFRREISLTYSRIQDIHLTSNVVERWLGLARIQIQTASASSDAEMTLQGLQEFEMVRDFLYTRMRGVKPRPAGVVEHAVVADPIASGLREVATELRAIRHLLESSRDQNRS